MSVDLDMEAEGRKEGVSTSWPIGMPRGVSTFLENHLHISRNLGGWEKILYGCNLYVPALHATTITIT